MGGRRRAYGIVERRKDCDTLIRVDSKALKVGKGVLRTCGSPRVAQ